MIFFAVNTKGDYRQRDPALESVGGLAGLASAMSNEFGPQEMPAGSNSWNWNLPLGWGKSMKGLGFEAVAKATGDAIKKIYKTQVEDKDANIKLAHKLMKISKIAGVNINTTAWSFMVLPSNVFPPPPAGPGIGPPLTGWSIGYHALGVGLFKSTEEEQEKDEGTKKALEDAGLRKVKLESDDEC